MIQIDGRGDVTWKRESITIVTSIICFGKRSSSLILFF